MFPDVLAAGEPLERVAFEEFRQRRLFGESVSKNQFHDHFAVTTDEWPDLPVGESTNEETTMVCTESVLRDLSRVDPERAGRLAAGQRQLPDIGDRFLDFELVGELGRGAFGRVYLARQGDLAERFVALKITPHISEEPNRLAQLQHTNIVPIYSAHRQGALQAICMPFLGPNTLADIVKTVEVAQVLPHSGRSIVSTIAVRPSSTVLGDEIPHIGPTKPQTESQFGERLPETIRRLSHMSYLDAAVWIMTRVADGLAFAHEHGVVHRDLKPGNILLTDDGEPLILDFNLAIQSSSVEQAVAIVGGTLPYSSPEQMVALRHGGTVGPSSDIYSFGVLLFQLLTGHLPHPVHTGSFDDVVVRMLEDRQTPAPSPRRSSPAVSPGLESIVLKCLARDPSERYENTRHLHEDLQRHLEHRPLRYVPNRSLVERAKKWSRRHPKLTSASSVALFSALLLATVAVAGASLVSRLQMTRAETASRQFHERLVDAQSSLNSPFLTTNRLEPAVQETEEVASTWRIAEPQGLERNPMFKRLSAKGQQQLRGEAVELLYLLCTGKAQMGMRASEPTERMRLLNEALRINAAAKHIVGSSEIPNAFTLLRARLLQQTNRETEAEQLLASTELQSDGQQDQRLLAFELGHQRRFKEAAEVLQQQLSHSPHDQVLWFSLGNAQLSLHQHAEAARCFSTAIAMNPDFVLAREHRGIARLGLKDYLGAKEDFEAVLQVRPQLTSVMVNRALALRGLGNAEQAMTELSRTLEQGASQTRIYFMRSQLRRKLGDLSGAAADRELGRTKTPADELSWVARGVDRLPEDADGALSDFRQALQVAPGSRPALQNIAHVLSERLGRNREAIEALDQILMIAPDEPATLASRGVLLARMGQREAAIQDAERVLTASNDPLHIYQAGCIYAQCSKLAPNDLPRATQLLAQAMARDAKLAATAVQDKDLEPLKGNAGFRKLLAAAMQIEQAMGSR